MPLVVISGGKVTYSSQIPRDVLRYDANRDIPQILPKVASDTLQHSSDSTVSGIIATDFPQYYKWIWLNRGLSGSVRVKYDIRSSVLDECIAVARLDVNRTVGTLSTPTSSDVWQTETVDLSSLSLYDKNFIALTMRGTAIGGGTGLPQVRNFRIYYDNDDIHVGHTTVDATMGTV